MGDEALGLALEALSRKERTVAELGEWLRSRGVEGEEVEGEEPAAEAGEAPAEAAADEE